MGMYSQDELDNLRDEANEDGMDDLDFWESVDAELASHRAQSWDASQTAEALATRDAKRLEEHERGVRLGWWTEDGTTLLTDTDEDEEGAP